MELWGDFLLRNDKIEVVISGDLPLRRPNMGGFYGNGNHTPGVIYDLTKRGENNDQITIFTPCGQKGDVNYVRIIENGSEGRAIIETMTSTAKSGTLFRQHQYILEDGLGWRFDHHDVAKRKRTKADHKCCRCMDSNAIKRQHEWDSVG